MRKVLLAILALLFSVYLFSQDTIFVSVDLRKVENKKITVTVKTDNPKPVNYLFPRTVPGTYSYKNYGFYCDNFVVSSINNSRQNLIKNSPNIVQIPSSNEFSYSSRQCYEWTMFMPESTMFIADSLFVLNWYSVVGYFADKLKTPYSVTIKKPSKLNCYTTLNYTNIGDSIVTVRAKDYDNLSDNVVMFFNEGGQVREFKTKTTNFKVVLYSESAYNPIDSVYPLIESTFKNLPAEVSYPNKDYTFYLYVTDKPMYAGIALEHKQSSVNLLFLNSCKPKMVVELLLHEFLHACYFPLVTRSSVIDELDLQNPKCDKHLWLYEGVTEYLSNKIAYLSGEETKEQFLHDVWDKWSSEEMDKRNLKRLRNESLTKLSSDIYSNHGRKHFGTVYMRGALVAMLLDVEIIKRTNGENSLFGVVNTLKERYCEKSFDSENLFTEINSIVNIDDLINKYVIGRRTVDIDYLLKEVGYVRETTKEKYNINDMNLYYYRYKETKEGLAMVVVFSVINKQLKMDEVTIVKVNGMAIDKKNNILFNNSKAYDLTILKDNKLFTYTVNAKSKRFTRRKTTFIADNVKSKYSKRYWNSL